MAKNAAAANAEAFRAYVRDRKIVIADSSPSSRSNLANVLVNLGAKSINVALASSLADAEMEIERMKPQIVICDYDLGGQRGLELLQRQRAQRPEAKDSLFVLVTGNTSQSAVARAAEEDVDTYILKPFTAEVLRLALIKAAILKIKPSEYAQAIDQGKDLMAKGDLAGSEAAFGRAKKLDPNPSLACFYLGQLEIMKQALKDAESDFSEGLAYNKIHYKCMVGLFEVMMQQKRWHEAYDVVKRVSQYFPANPQRLNQVLKLAILTRSYDDVERYYQVFTKLDDRAEEIIRHICAALVVCGKYYLQHSHQSRALELFKKAAITASGRTKILREIILALTEFDLTKEAKEYLERFPMDSRQDPNYLAMELLVLDNTPDLDPGAIIARGRKMIESGGEDELIYKIVIRRSMEVGWADAADGLRVKALAKFPDQAAWFKELPKVKPREKAAAEKPASGGKAA